MHQYSESQYTVLPSISPVSFHSWHCLSFPTKLHQSISQAKSKHFKRFKTLFSIGHKKIVHLQNEDWLSWIRKNLRSGKIEWKLEMSLACSPPAEGMTALNYTEKKNQLVKLKKKKTLRVLSRLVWKQQIFENNERKDKK